MNSLVKARELTKKFGPQTAVKAIDFDINAGEVVGFLGPNGAGKTTTIRMLLNLLTPTTGELTLFGTDYRSNRRKILSQMNASSGTLTLPGKLSVLENLKVFADMYALSNPSKRINALIKKFDLEALKNKPVFSLSTGQQVRVSLAKAFLNRPRLLLLDEPTSSLDPDVADRIRSFLMEMVEEEGTTVFLTSHNMNEVEKICTRVLFLNKGVIEAEGSPKELARRVKRWTVTLKPKPALQSLPDIKLPHQCEVTIKSGVLTAELDKSDVGPFLTTLVQNGIKLDDIRIHEPTLEDFFVHSARKQ